ncbi:MAG: TonB-dependent receptor [Alphaproteobacteria bacterium]|nr:MAG: TonB-dependent receptor [Alphaproteobacteria bacterium]
MRTEGLSRLLRGSARLRVVLATTVAAGALTGGVAVAQPAEEAAVAGLEEIVVTARKRTESLQTAPVSVAAISSQTLKFRSLDNFKDMANSVPNIDINGGIPNGGGSAAQIFIRGVGQDDYAFPNEPGVGLYIDGVYISRSAGSDFSFMDLERIEILRGPQGTLYGKNTIGGAVKIITKLPDGETEGELSATVGSYERLDFQGNASFKISDTVFAKIAASSRRRDGLGTNFIGQDLGNEDREQVRGTLRFVPNEEWDIILRADYSRQRQNGPAGSMVFFERNAANAIGIDTINGLLAPARAAELGLQPPFDTYGDAFVKTLEEDGKDVYNSFGTEETRDWADIWGASLEVNWQGDNIAFKSITAYRDSQIDVRRDSEHTPFEIVRVDNPEDTNQLSQEFQLSGVAFDSKLNWLVGVFGLREKGDSTLFAPLLSGLFAATGGLADNTAFITAELDAYSVAVFGEGTYYFSDKLGLTVGARLTYDDKEYIYGLSRPESGLVPLPPTELSDSWTELTPKAAIEFRATEDIMAYASVSRGYKAGGYNARALSGNPPKAFDPEFITAYEIGVKSSWLDNRLTVNAAAFYNDYSDIQLLSVLNLGGGNVETVIENAGKARIIGGEIEAVALPHPDLLLGLGIGILDNKYKEIDAETQQAGILESNELINAPDFSLNASAQYTAHLGNAGELVLFTDVVHRSSQYRDAVNTPQLKADAYWLWNARATYIPSSQAYELAFFVTNITDEIYVTNGVEVLGLGYVEAYYSRPREWGASLTVHF